MYQLMVHTLLNDSNSSEIEIESIDEVTLVGYPWLEKHGHGSRTTIWRKVKAGKFPKPLDDDGKRKWTLAQIKRHLLQNNVNQAT